MCQSSVVTFLGILCVRYVELRHILSVCALCWNSGAMLDKESLTVKPLKQGLLYKEHTFQWHIHRPMKWQSVSSHATPSCSVNFLHLWRIDPLILSNARTSVDTCCCHCCRLSFSSDSHGRAWGLAKRQSQRHVRTTIDSVKYGDVSRIECVVVTLATSQKMWSVMLYAPLRFCEFASSFSALLCHRLWYRTCHYFIFVVVKYCARVLEVQQGNLQEKKRKQTA